MRNKMDQWDVKANLLGCLIRRAMGSNTTFFVRRIDDEAFLCYPDDGPERDWGLVYGATKEECIHQIINWEKLGYGWDRETNR